MENKFITTISIRSLLSTNEAIYLMRTPFNESHPDFELLENRFIAKKMKSEIMEPLCQDFNLFSNPDKAEEKFNELLKSNPEYLIEVALLMTNSITEPL